MTIAKVFAPAFFKKRAGSRGGAPGQAPSPAAARSEADVQRCLHFHRRNQKAAPQWPCAPRYNLHIIGRWVACRILYCFQLPTAGGSREACKPNSEPASRITKCGLMKDASRTPQGRELILSYSPAAKLEPFSREIVQEVSPYSSSSSSSNRRSIKRSYTSVSSSSVSRVDSSSSPFSSMDFRITRP